MLDLSLIVPTKNRTHFLEKLLRYHAEAGFQGVMWIGDASDAPALEKNRELIKKFSGRLRLQHLRQPQTSLIEGTIQMLGQATTEFSVLSGDDDFLVPRELERCEAFLKTHPDYSCACGEQAYVYVRRRSDQTLVIDQIHAGYSALHREELPSKRVAQYIRFGRAGNTFSVQRTKEMWGRWKKGSELGLDATKYHGCLHEVGINIVSLIHGKQMKFSDLYHVMLRHTERDATMTSNQGDARWLQRMCAWNWAQDVPKLVGWWMEELMRCEKISESPARDIAEAVFFACWIPTMTRWRDDLLQKQNRLPRYDINSKEFFLHFLKRQKWIRAAWEGMRGAHRISPKTFLKEGAPFYNDFLPIRKLL